MVECCTITVADLKVRATLQTRSITPDGQGGFEESWTAEPQVTLWGKIQNLTGTERWEAQRTESTNLLNFFSRFRGNADGAPAWSATDVRFIIRGRYYNILSIQDLNMEKKWLKFLIQEGDPA